MTAVHPRPFSARSNKTFSSPGRVAGLTAAGSHIVPEYPFSYADSGYIFLWKDSALHVRGSYGSSGDRGPLHLPSHCGFCQHRRETAEKRIFVCLHAFPLHTGHGCHYHSAHVYDISGSEANASVRVLLVLLRLLPSRLILTRSFCIVSSGLIWKKKRSFQKRKHGKHGFPKKHPA